MITQPNTRGTSEKKTWTKPQLHCIYSTMSDVEGLDGMNAEATFASLPTS